MEHSKHALPGGIGGIFSGRLTVPDIAFAFWCFYEVKILITFLMFQSAPRIGAVVGAAITVFFVYVLALVVFTGDKGALRYRSQTLETKVLFALVAWSGITLGWTQAASLSSAFGYWSIMALDVLAVFMMICMARIEDVAIRSLQGIVIGGLIVAGVTVLSGATDAHGRLGDQAFLHPNALGFLLAVATLCAVYLMTRYDLPKHRALIWVIAAGLLFAGLLSTLSKTSIAAFSGAILVYLITSRTGIGKKAAFLLIATATIGAAYTTVSTYLAEYFAERQGQTAATLTGRTLAWERSWEMIQSRPILGYGFGAYQDVGPQIGGTDHTYTAHNEVLHLWFSLGALGVVFVVLLYAIFLWRVYRARKWHTYYLLPQEAALGLAFLVFALLYGLVEAATQGGLVFPLPLLLLMIAWISRKRGQALTRDRSVDQFP